ncbi:hypothetical protein BHE74_00025743, partial [Ensete ventricosum]
MELIYLLPVDRRPSIVARCCHYRSWQSLLATEVPSLPPSVVVVGPPLLAIEVASLPAASSLVRDDPNRISSPPHCPTIASHRYAQVPPTSCFFYVVLGSARKEYGSLEYAIFTRCQGDRCVVNRGEGLTTVDFSGGDAATAGAIGRSEGQREKRAVVDLLSFDSENELIADGVGKVPLLVSAD